jgi:hypothetical protein
MIVFDIFDMQDQPYTYNNANPLQCLIDFFYFIIFKRHSQLYKLRNFLL